MKRWMPTVFLVIVLGVVLSGCVSARAPAQQMKVVEIAAVNTAFSPKEITLEKGKPVKVLFNNKDGADHDWVVKNLPTTKKDEHKEGEKGHQSGNASDLHADAQAGKTGTVEFTPIKAGTYQIVCTIPGHKEMGMVGTLTVI